MTIPKMLCLGCALPAGHPGPHGSLWPPPRDIPKPEKEMPVTYDGTVVGNAKLLPDNTVSIQLTEDEYGNAFKGLVNDSLFLSVKSTPQSQHNRR